MNSAGKQPVVNDLLHSNAMKGDSSRVDQFLDLVSRNRRPSVHRRRSTVDDVVRRRSGGGRTDGVHLVGEERSEISRRVIVKIRRWRFHPVHLIVTATTPSPCLQQSHPASRYCSLVHTVRAAVSVSPATSVGRLHHKSAENVVRKLSHVVAVHDTQNRTTALYAWSSGVS